MNAEAKKRDKDIDLPFICPVTKREFKSGMGLAIYLSKTLKVDHSEYYDLYIIPSIVCDEKDFLVHSSLSQRFLYPFATEMNLPLPPQKKHLLSR